MDFASEERLTVVDHPLIKHKLSVIRNEDTPDYLFRQTVREITLLEGYAATQDLATRSVEVKRLLPRVNVNPSGASSRWLFPFCVQALACSTACWT